jgi:periplasmic protein TonB
MFAPLPQSGRRLWRGSLCASLAFHLAVLWVVSRHPRAIFVQPTSIRFGESGKYLGPVYLPSAAALSEVAGESRAHRRTASTPAKKQPLVVARKQKPKAEVARAVEGTESDSAKLTAAAPAPVRAGNPNGRLLQGPGSSRETRIALPVVGPQPPISPSDLPMGNNGDVIVEITIDEQGNVVKTAVLKGIRNDLDQKVIATLQGWRFKPATQDGVPIPSQQDVYFHFGR